MLKKIFKPLKKETIIEIQNKIRKHLPVTIYLVITYRNYYFQQLNKVLKGHDARRGTVKWQRARPLECYYTKRLPVQTTWKAT